MFTFVTTATTSTRTVKRLLKGNASGGYWVALEEIEQLDETNLFLLSRFVSAAHS